MENIKKLIEIFRESTKRFITPFIKSSIWLMSAIAFGLLQLWFLGLRNTLVKVPFPYEEILIEGGLLFFSGTVVTSITADYYLSKIPIDSRLVSGFLFYFFPLLVVVISSGIYVVCFGKTSTELDMNFLADIELIILVLTIIYAFVAKTILFYLEN